MAVWIEWLDGSRLQRGEVKKEDKSKLQVITTTGRTVSVPQKRFFLRHPAVGDCDGFFTAIDDSSREIDCELLHETLGAGKDFSLHEVAACWFSSDAPSVANLSVMLVACLNGAPWFKVDAMGRVRSNRLEEIDRFRKEREAEERLAEEVEAANHLLLYGVESPLVIPADAEGRALFSRLEAFLNESLIHGQPVEKPPGLAEALKHASHHSSLEPMDLVRGWLEKNGELPDPYRVHMQRFNQAWLGTAPSPEERFTPCRTRYAPAEPAEIRRISEAADALVESLPSPLHPFIFSVDDEGVEEIDDALSAVRLDAQRFRVGVHIAAPGAVIVEDSAVHAQACTRCTTVYQPDLKWTMLPREIIDRFSLRAGTLQPAMSTYYTFSLDTFDLLETEVRLDSVKLSRNFTYHGLNEALDGVFFPDLEHVRTDPDRVHRWLEEDVRTFPWNKTSAFPKEAAEAIDLLVPLARHLFVQRVRGGADLFFRTEYKITVRSEDAVEIIPREKNCIIEGVVSEMMILNNGWTAGRLAEADMPAIYRTQRQVPAGDVGGREVYRTQADLTVIPREHAGLGSSLYCWSTSPLRRYADLLNQRQLASMIHGSPPAFEDTSELLIRAKKTEFQNQAANTHQRAMERYWTLKYVEQHNDAPFPVEVHTPSGRKWASFIGIPLKVTLDPDLAVPRGALAFVPERFDYYTLHVEGRLEPA
ncbi:MAG: ribonuclease catalytic domain-containing protein [Planctomycetota bacterium]